MKTMEEISGEYAQVCTQLGDIAYRISVFEEDARKLRRKLRQLNMEAAALRNAEHNKQVEEAKNGEADKAGTSEASE